MSAIYGRPVVIERGAFAKSDSVHEVLMKAALARVGREAGESRRSPVGLYELSLTNPALGEALSAQEAERRLAELRAVGRPVLLSNISANFNFTSYLKRFTNGPIRFAVGLSHVVHVFHEAYYTALDGGVLEGVAQLLGADVKLYVLPQPVKDLLAALEALEGGTELWSLPEEGIARLENTEPTTRLRHLYRYMRETGTLVTIESS